MPFGEFKEPLLKLRGGPLSPNHISYSGERQTPNGDLAILESGVGGGQALTKL